ncbi:MAG TPA: DUF1015 domain-containing protein, partial [Acidimicrobiales bacterium]|nr:DUF1015 domain-containing protein [Acidimicrobiales bacterium]
IAPDLSRRLAALGIAVPDLLLPARGVDLAAWSVVACDQFTSQPEYWERVDQLVGERPSTLRLIYPEAQLDRPDREERIAAIHAAMADYLARGVLVPWPATLVLVRRVDSHGRTRWGLLVALDLEQYDWHPGSHGLIRATEGTIESRLPPRVQVRRGAPLEVPHTLVLMSDADHGVIGPLAASAKLREPLYDTSLMLGGGRVTGWAVDQAAHLEAVTSALEHLAAGLDPDNPLLFAIGDGNHGFATAKTCWDELKAGLSEEERATHPARFALVEIVNVLDPGLSFEPIHRVLFGLSRADFDAELARHCTGFRVESVEPTEVAGLADDQSSGQRFGIADSDGAAIYTLSDPHGAIAVATLQPVLDALVDSEECEVDYIHGADVAAELATEPGNLAVFLPEFDKATVFDAIRVGGELPRKTFSLGDASDKRYYLEARRIS